MKHALGFSDGDVASLNEESLNWLYWNGSEWPASSVSCQLTAFRRTAATASICRDHV